MDLNLFPKAVRVVRMKSSPLYAREPHGMQTRDAIERLFSPGESGLRHPPLILAPMAGVTDLPFRRMAHRFGAALTVSEMIASQAMIRRVPVCLKLSDPGEGTGPFAVQIAGADPEAMARAARMQEGLGAGIIDINMGCPVRKIVGSGAGAALLRDESLAGRVMEAVVRAVTVPVTVKIRLGWDESSRNGLAIARIAEASGVRCLTVHGRTRAQMYSGCADWGAIGEIKSRVSIPVVGNGDVTTPERARRLWRETGVDGLMIGRAALGHPWIFREVAHYLATGELLPPPAAAERGEVIVGHFREMIAHHGPHTGHLLARKHLGWFTRGLPDGARFRDRLNHAPHAEAALELLLGFLGLSDRARAA